MSIKMGKYQKEYYNIEDMYGDSLMSNHKDHPWDERITKIAKAIM